MSASPASPAPPLRLHVGHHFYGAGNFGDDLMLAGLLAAAAERFGLSSPPQFTCCIPFDPAPQRLRFPQVHWLPYAAEAREQCVRDCDAWLGPGGSPFQGEQGTWFLDHLAGEAELCRRYGKPMYYLGVGVHSRRDLEHGATRDVLRSAEHVWTRAAESALGFADVTGPDRVTAGADLSHVYLRTARFAPVEPGTVGLVLNFEDATQLDPAALAAVMEDPQWREVRWLHQEVRELPGSEADLWRALPDAWRGKVRVRVPDYRGATLAGLLEAWGTPEVLVTSRYHAAIVGAWAGARVVVVERSDKVSALCRELGLTGMPSLRDAGELARAVRSAQPVPRSALEAQAELAGRCCREFFDRLQDAARDGRAAFHSPGTPLPPDRLPAR